MRGINRLTSTFFVEMMDGTCAVFSVVRGGFPFGGEYVRWNEDAKPVSMVMGDSSGTHIVAGMRYPLTKEEASRVIGIAEP